MKNILFALLLSFTAAAQQQDSIYCIQIFTTTDPFLIRAEHITLAVADVYLESLPDFHRVLVTHDSQDEAEIMLHTWRRVHKDAFITVRTREQVEDMVRIWEI